MQKIISKKQSNGFAPLNKIKAAKKKMLDSKHLTGFTMIEMLVSITIIVLLFSIFLANYHGAKKIGELNMAAQKLASDIRIAENYALGLKDFGSNPPNGGWGLRFNKGSSEYIIFADKDASGKYRASEDGTADNENYQTLILPGNISIKGFNIDGDTHRNYLYIVCIPPDLKIKINAAQNENNDSLPIKGANTVIITIKNSNGQEKKIKINKFGLVDVN